MTQQYSCTAKGNPGASIIQVNSCHGYHSVITMVTGQCIELRLVDCEAERPIRFTQYVTSLPLPLTDTEPRFSQVKPCSPSTLAVSSVTCHEEDTG